MLKFWRLDVSLVFLEVPYNRLHKLGVTLVTVVATSFLLILVRDRDPIAFPADSYSRSLEVLEDGHKYILPRSSAANIDWSNSPVVQLNIYPSRR